MALGIEREKRNSLQLTIALMLSIVTGMAAKPTDDRGRMTDDRRPMDD
jgi:hypothetical protein